MNLKNYTTDETQKYIRRGEEIHGIAPNKRLTVEEYNFIRKYNVPKDRIISLNIENKSLPTKIENMKLTKILIDKNKQKRTLYRGYNNSKTMNENIPDFRIGVPVDRETIKQALFF